MGDTTEHDSSAGSAEQSATVPSQTSTTVTSTPDPFEDGPNEPASEVSGSRTEGENPNPFED
jgi:hypothetical protein